MEALTAGLVALLGSGETAPASGPVYDVIAARYTAPVRIAVLETPAGFQPNSAQVAGRIADHLRVRLQNARPAIDVLPARARGTPASPDAPETTAALRDADIIFLGPGSPTYAVRQLHASLAWQRLTARHRRGAAVITASAATIAFSRVALPVYEIYKVGADLHWHAGLDFFGAFGLALAIVPHWNNREGGAELDTSHCYMGAERFARLYAMLPADVTVVGIDEHTALLVDLNHGTGRVLGRGGVTVIRGGNEERFARTAELSLTALGPFRLPEPADGIPPEVWAEMAGAPPAEAPPPSIPGEISALVVERQAARSRRDWAAADSLRRAIAERGWQVRDTPDGPVVEPAAG